MSDKKRKMICAGRDRCVYGPGRTIMDHCGIHDEVESCKKSCPVIGAPDAECRPATDEELVYYKMLDPGGQ
jgi:hypothetical protein